MHFAIGLAALGGPLTPMLLLRGAGSPYWLLLLPILLAGVWLLFGSPLWDALRRQVTYYYLSDARLVVDRRWFWGVRRREWSLADIREARAAPPHVELTATSSDGALISFRLEYLDDVRQTADQVSQALRDARPLPETRFRD